MEPVDKTEKQRVLGLGMFVLSSCLASYTLAFEIERGVVDVGIKWSSRPGNFVILLLAILSICAYSCKLRRLDIGLSATFFVGAILAERVFYERTLWLVCGLALTVVGMAHVFSSWRRVRSGVFSVVPVLAWLVGTYVQAVCWLNVLAPYQLSTFFSGGSTS